MKDKKKQYLALPLLCWDIYSLYLKKEFNVPSNISDAPLLSTRSRVKKKSI